MSERLKHLLGIIWCDKPENMNSLKGVNADVCI